MCKKKVENVVVQLFVTTGQENKYARVTTEYAYSTNPSRMDVEANPVNILFSA